MAFRVCNWIIRKSSTHVSKVLIVNSARHESTSPFLRREGGAVAARSRHGVSFTPACFITSDAFLNRLRGSRAVEADDSSCSASVPHDSGEQLSLLGKHPDEPENPRVLKVAIVGAPNVGKSTLSNQLLGRKVFAASKKVHTTRSRALGVLTEDDTQIILLDTPGFTTPGKVKRHQLEKSLLLDPWTAVKEADLMVVMVDVSDKWTCNKLDFEVLKCLAQHPDVPAVLILNKVDLLKSKNRLLDITEQLTAGVVNGRRMQVRPVIKPAGAEKTAVRDEGPLELPGDTGPGGEAPSDPRKEQLRTLRNQHGWPGFKDVFMLSSVDSEDVETLKRYLVGGAKPGPWLYHSDVLTDQSPEEICNNMVREKLLEYLPAEVPYTMTQSIDLWQERDNGELDIAVKLYVKKEAHMKMVIGTAGQTVARMAGEAGEDLSRVFLRDVRLKLTVKLKN